MRDEAQLAGLESEKLFTYPLANAWTYACLADARAMASTYVKDGAARVNERAAAPLAQAAGLYQEIHRALDSGKAYAPYPWDLNEGEAWSQYARRSEAILLDPAKDLEREALAVLEEALSHMPRRSG